jgi:CheY-like chemotaxis protein
VESRPGDGSNFIFTIKVKRNKGAAPAEAPANPHEEIRPGEFRDFRILLAEDIELNKEVTQAILEDTGVDIQWAENGRKAVSAYTAHPERFDLILMDLQRPEMDGYEATRHIRVFEEERRKAFPAAESPGSAAMPHIPIIAMTANVFKEDIEQCRRAGMDGHIGKPINIDELFAVLRRYLRREAEKQPAFGVEPE